MNYITRKRFKGKCISGEVNLPFNTKCELINNNLITYNNRPICYTTSQNAYDYFVNDFDFNGIRRAELINNILDITTNKNSKLYNKIWEVILESEFMQKYRRPEHLEVWLWNFDFYNASINELEKIYNLIKGVK